MLYFSRGTSINFNYTAEFNKEWHALKLDEKDRFDFETGIVTYYRNLPVNNYGKKFPGNIIQGTGGAYKYRYRAPDSPQGKSSSYRTIYFIANNNQLWFLTIYKKNQKATLSDREKADLRAFSRLLTLKGL